MADALCGPSNPLQSFTKHTQADRTLQQDRLHSRYAPAESSFRSIDPRATANADANFHAFENSKAQLFPVQPFQPLHHAPATSNWAADFQNLHISSQPLPVAQFRHEAPLIKSTNGGWHNEFMRFHQNDISSSTALGKQPEVQQQAFNPIQQNTFMPSYQTNGTLLNQQYEQFGQHQAREASPQIEQAFMDAFAQAEEMDQCYRQQYVQAEPEVVKETPQVEIPETTLESIRIGSDAINYVEKSDRTMEQDIQDADELARTAGHLLDAVRHDTSEKFQNSQFLHLMRMLRDREVQVLDNDFAMTEQVQESIPASQNQVSHMPPQQESGIEERLHSHDPNTFQFPDMNSVYEPEAPKKSRSRTRYPGSWDYPAFTQIDDNQRGRVDVSSLHPGGRYYPEQSPPLV